MGVAQYVLSSVLSFSTLLLVGALIYIVWGFCSWYGVSARSLCCIQLFLCCSIICALLAVLSIVINWAVVSTTNQACSRGEEPRSGVDCGDKEARASLLDAAFVATVFGVVLGGAACALAYLSYSLAAKHSEYFVPIPPLMLAQQGAHVVGAPAQPPYGQPNPFLAAASGHYAHPALNHPAAAAAVPYAPGTVALPASAAGFYAARGVAPPAVVGLPPPYGYSHPSGAPAAVAGAPVPSSYSIVPPPASSSTTI